MNNEKTGGHAFPTLFIEPEHGSGYAGMTLRDWFAGQFLAGCASSPYTHASIANACYAMADAMLAERAKAKGEQV
jgi:hypothetical protein